MINNKYFILKPGIQLFLFILGTAVMFSCCTTNQSGININKKQDEKKFRITCIAPNQSVKMGESVEIELSPMKKYEPDSVIVIHNNSGIGLKRIDRLHFSFTPDVKKCGRQNLNFRVIYSDTLSEDHSLTVLFLPNQKPKELSFKVLRSFKHDSKAYTQGLIYSNNILFESTGKEYASSIRKVNPKNGDIILNKPLEPEIFGEGIGIIGDKIYMLTYVSHIGFVFDTVKFELIRKFPLQTREGWGLTSDVKQLIMSDGTSMIYFLDPEYTTTTDQIEICDDTGFIDSLNELEDTPYGLFANVYGETYVLVIDKSTGIVTGKIDFSSIFPNSIPDDMDHVLNGIAFNSKTNTFYITGKYWPIMYEVKINV